MLDLEKIVVDLAEAFKAVDTKKPQCKQWPSGIGAFPEREMVRLALEHLRHQGVDYNSALLEENYPAAGRARCDLVIPGEWAIEFKQSGVFVSNGMENDNWSRTLLHPFLGVKDGVAKSLVGDAIKLMCSGFPEKKAIILLVFEHEPEDIDIELPLGMFEYGARHLIGIPLGPRISHSMRSLVHPHHQQLKVFGWQIDELSARFPSTNSEWLDREVNRFLQITKKVQDRKSGIAIAQNTTIGELRRSFKDVYGMSLRIMDGRQIASDDILLINVSKKTFDDNVLQVSSHAKIGTIEKLFFSQLGLRVQIEDHSGKLVSNSATIAKGRRKSVKRS